MTTPLAEKIIRAVTERHGGGYSVVVYPYGEHGLRAVVMKAVGKKVKLIPQWTSTTEDVTGLSLKEVYNGLWGRLCVQMKESA